jgi:hypothetical protein
LLRDGTPFRLALHPRDVEHPSSRAEIVELIARLERDGWRPASLSEVAPA